MSLLSAFIKHKEKKGQILKVVIPKKPGMSGVLQTVQIMKRLKNKYKVDLAVRQLAVEVVKPYRINKRRADAIFSYLKKRINYIPDVAGVETIQTPVYTLKYGGGDCDDLSLLIASFLEAVGINTRFVIAGKNGVYSHIFVLADIDREPVPYDLTLNRPGVMSKRYTHFEII